MLNQITMQGRICAEPDYRETEKYKMCRFKIACERDYAEGGEKKTDFVSCTAFGNTAPFVHGYFNVGDMIVVSGRLQIDEDKENHKYYTSIRVDNAYFAGSKKEPSTKSSKKESHQQSSQERFRELNNMDDGDLPF